MAPGANFINAVISPVVRSNSSVLASQPGNRVFCHSMVEGRTRCECVSDVCDPFGVTASMAILRFVIFEAILAVLGPDTKCRKTPPGAAAQPLFHQRFLPSIIVTGTASRSNASNSLALTP